MRLTVPCLLLLILGCGPESVSRNANMLSLDGKALGSTWSVKVWSEQRLDREELGKSIVTEIERAEKIFSHWRPDSELYQFNQALTTSPVSIHPQLHALMKHAWWMYQQTKGAFDPTIAPLVNLWGFGPVSVNRFAIPTEEEIKQALRQTGLGKLEILPDKQVRKKRPDLQIDLSGSAKGEIIDQVCQLLDRRGLLNYLVEIGGEIRARGGVMGDPGWIVALEDGFVGEDRKMTKISLIDYAVATSGTYRQTKPNPDSTKSASHLINPRTGRPVEHNLVAVNVLAPTARDADAFATALMVLGLKEGMHLAREMNLPARFCIKDGKFHRYKHTPHFDSMYPRN
ncbi:MAG: FAD:protein FMN transferase [Opitutae bacterium]|jgi:FAD:protein FMN transferase|nr:FAD:protein FMN transferase [Opitutae bacterium]